MTARGFTAEDFERAERRKNWKSKRPKGSIPVLSDEILDDAEWLRDWLTAALKPREGWRIFDFEHGEDLDLPCTLTVANGQDSVRYRFSSQRDLMSSPGKMRDSISTVASGQLRPPELKPGEKGDIWQALCALRPALQDADTEPEQARDWLFRVMKHARPIEGHTLVNTDGQRQALLALKRAGEFSYLDAIAVTKRPEDPWPRQPTCLIDRETGAIVLRVRESLTLLRHIEDVKPIREKVLTYRWSEIGVVKRHFDLGRRLHEPHLKATLYLVPQEAKPAE